MTVQQAVDITAEEVKEVLKGAPPAVDQQIKVVDVGKYNVAVGVVHRGKVTRSPDGAVRGIAHHHQTEAYVIISGSGILVTGGTIIDGKELSKDSQAYQIMNGPSVTGTVKDGYARFVKVGDIVIIPPDVFHGWGEVADHVDYLSVRPDPDRVLPAGYVNPAIKK